MAEDVAIVGAGPVGLMLANELRIAGVDVVVYDKLPVATGESRAIGYTRRAGRALRRRRRAGLRGLRPGGERGEVADGVRWVVGCDRTGSTVRRRAGIPVARAPATGGVLVRPDGYVAWTGGAGDPGLDGALAEWFGGTLS